jgi:hypothetical protein
MTQLSLMQTRGASLSVKILVCIWMFLAVFVYLLLFGPPEFWSICERMGTWYLFRQWHDWLQPFFTAGYLS